MALKELLSNDEHKWNLLFGIFYVLLVFILSGFVWLVDEKYPTSISVFDFILISLATFRLVRLFVYDSVTTFIKEYFASATRGPGRTMHHLLGCPWCFGMWAGLFVVFFYFVMPMAWLVLLILAISGVGTFIQILMNMIGWRAELLKLEAKSRE